MLGPADDTVGQSFTWHWLFTNWLEAGIDLGSAPLVDKRPAVVAECPPNEVEVIMCIGIVRVESEGVLQRRNGVFQFAVRQKSNSEVIPDAG